MPVTKKKECHTSKLLITAHKVKIQSNAAKMNTKGAWKVSVLMPFDEVMLFTLKIHLLIIEQNTNKNNKTGQ